MARKQSRVDKIQVELSRVQVAQLLTSLAWVEESGAPADVQRETYAFMRYLTRRGLRRWGDGWMARL